MEKNITLYERGNCNPKLTEKILSEMDRKGIKIGLVPKGHYEGLNYLFDNQTYVTLEKWNWKYFYIGSNKEEYITLIIEQPIKKVLGIKKKTKLPKELVTIINSFNFKKTIPGIYNIQESDSYKKPGIDKKLAKEILLRHGSPAHVKGYEEISEINLTPKEELKIDTPAISAAFIIGTAISGGDPDFGVAFAKFVKKIKIKKESKKNGFKKS